MHYKHKKLLTLLCCNFSTNWLLYLLYGAKTFGRILILCSTLNFTIIHNSYAEEKGTLDTIIDILSGLTCETQGVGDLLRTEFSHTCIPASFFSFGIANIISPGIYANTMLRLKINDHVLFDHDYPGGQCARNNKIDPNDPKLTFAFCNNIKLAAVRFEAIAISAIAIAKAVLTGTDPWDDIMEAWKSNKGGYHTIYKDQKDGDTGVMLDVPLPVVFKVVKQKDTMCVAAPTILADWVAVGCKYIREPYPESMYASFMNLDSSNAKEGSNKAATDPMAIVDCGLSSSSCYQRAYNNSKTAIVISAPLIECIKEMTARLLISKDVCTFDDVNKVINSSKRESSVLFQFQRNMHRTVTALLTIYVIFFGFKIVLSSDIPPKNEIINFVLKMLFVTYFSVGINITPGSSSDYNRLDGMVQWAFPLLLGGIDTLGGWVMNASPSDLCKFEPKDYNDKSLSYMPLWDALDCRVSHYLGLDILSTLMVENQYRNHDFKNFDFFSFSAPPYVYLLIPAIISGNMTLVSLALSYPLLVISVGAFMVNATVMCMISIVILGVLAPLFVPMFLFEYTRGYFESWVKLLISFLLQPMVVVTFMILMFSVYDVGFYGHCKYTSKTIQNSIESGGDGKRAVKIFFVDNDWSKYNSEAEVKSCKNSLGYMLNNPLATVVDFAKDNLNEMLTEKPGSGSTSSHLSKFQFLQGIIMGPGMFFVSPKLVFEKIKDIVLALVTACFTLYLMYHLSAQLADFAADMTEGVALSSVAIHPQAIYKAGMAAIGAAGKMGAADKAAGGGGAKDLAGGGKGGGSSGDKGELAGDSDSSGGGESGGDTVSTGGSVGATGSVGGGMKSLGGSGVSLPIRHITEATTTGVSEGGSSSGAGSSHESRANFETSTSDGAVLVPTTTIAETSNSINSSPQLATNKQELGKPLDKVGSASTLPKEKKSYGLLPKTPKEMEEHTLQPGEAGYVKQEIRNREIKDRNAKLEEQAFKDFKEKPLKNRAAKQIIADRTNVKVKKDGSDENS
ncbi:type IV secretion system protein [Candidatus Tisiphia endosymbiont of Hybos culiciformis]|uniref:type IV secretion system protein n=1 Tax=Candidatus Tisiphia endosymbiont of Hybos culiciformis TaxID=3139331 RepID=UPI003CCAF9B7